VIRARPRFEKSLPQVKEMAARLQLTGLAQVPAIDLQAGEGIHARHDHVIRDDGAEFEGKRVERPRELLRGNDERRRETVLVPRLDAIRAGAQVLDRQTLDKDECRRGRNRVAVGRRVHDEGLQARAEQARQVAHERVDRVGNVHACNCRMSVMRLRELNVGCFGGGTGLPSLLGGLKHNPWVHADAVVTMFDSGGSSGVLRDELGVLPPGDVLRCALALSRNTRETRRVLLARLPTLEHAKLGGHTGGNLLLSMMESYSGNFLDAIDGLRALLGCRGRVWPVTVEHASVCAEYGDGSITRGEVEVDALQSSGRFVRRIWLEPSVAIHPAVADAIARFDAVTIGPGSFYTSLMPIFLVRGVAEALKRMPGPVILVANLLTEGRGMARFTAADAVTRIEEAIGRPVDVVLTNNTWPSTAVLDRYAVEHKEPLQPGALPAHCEQVSGAFWTSEIARHDRLRVAYAVWSVLSRRLLGS
jgi:uncharacterized cofD-like protein